MQPIKAISLTPTVTYWLENSRHPRILHVFDQACNLINERKEILSIVMPQIGNGPFNLVVRDEILFSQHLNVEFQVSVFDNQITLGDLVINTKNAKLWNPRPNWESLYAKKDHIIKILLSNYQARGLDTGFAIAQPYSTTTFNLANYQLSNSLIASLAIADISSSITSAKQLAGLGQGLTPSGDDFMMGTIHAMWIIHPYEIAREIAEEITNTAAPLTTSLSAAWLKSAGRGEAGILWHNFFDALLSSDSIAVELGASKILAVGETSGADALAGFIGAFISYVEIEKSHVIPKHI